MSWSIPKMCGKPNAVRPVSDAAFDAAAKNYAGKTEEQDVLGAKAAVAEWLAETAQAIAEDEGVIVEANGSRGWSLTININCTKTKLLT